MENNREIVLALSAYVNGTLDEDEDEFRSCCGDEDELKENDEDELEETDEDELNENDEDELEENDEDELKDESDEDELKDDNDEDELKDENDEDELKDENYVKMYFKGVSVDYPGSRISGIGVVMERSNDDDSPILVQKRLGFYVEESVADYLALLDGLSVAIQNNIKLVFAFTDSQVLCDQITRDEEIENPLLSALKQRIQEKASNFENFALKFLPAINLQKAVKLAQVAVGVVSFPPKGEKTTETCSICCEEKLSYMTIRMKCSHKFCSDCMKTYVQEKILSFQVPIKCPQARCKCCISAAECKSFLTFSSYEALEILLIKANIRNMEKIYCPYPSCSILLDPRECLSTRASSSSNSDYGCVECPACERFICADCGFPWHASMTCEEYQSMPLEERDDSYSALHHLSRNKRMARRCQLCQRMNELTHGCFHITCWCGHEYCYACGSDYEDGEQTCECSFWDEKDYIEDNISTYPPQQFEQWAWESFVSLPASDAYTEQERSQLALIQRFLAGGFSLTDQQPYQSPPRCTDSYVDVMKDLHQLPWLERFVSVISDNFYEEYVQ